jgi:hypothetical protein
MRFLLFSHDAVRPNPNPTSDELFWRPELIVSADVFFEIAKSGTGLMVCALIRRGSPLLPSRSLRREDLTFSLWRFSSGVRRFIGGIGAALRLQGGAPCRQSPPRLKQPTASIIGFVGI